MKEFVDSVNELFVERKRLKKELREVEDRIASALKCLGFSDLTISNIYGIDVPVISFEPFEFEEEKEPVVWKNIDKSES